jgi:hypothetical protein
MTILAALMVGFVLGVLAVYVFVRTVGGWHR